MILKFKNGSGIHIKKKNRGKFTSYCGGNVTSACIARAKASDNPTLVKRATFAANARKWKHQEGGILYKYQVGGYIHSQNTLEAISNGSAATGLLSGFGKVMSKILPTWMLKAGTYVSPLNYVAAISKGSINPKVGEEEIATWHPNLLLAARLGEVIFGGKAVKGTGNAVVNTAAKAGNKTARAYIISKEFNKGIKLNTRNGRIEVSDNYFNAPDKWYRITETPEKYGIMELGKNVTTHDAPKTLGTINGWRSSILNAKVTKGPEGFVKKPSKIELNIRRKNGQAHGNTSLAAKGKLWGGTTSGSRLFPEGVIEGQAPSMINYGIDRTNFVVTPWEEVPNGGRVGFHTGEMPMSNLGWFQRTKNGTYTYEPIIPEKRILIGINRVVGKDGKIRLLLPSHTFLKPREVTLEPLGNNKYYIHMRTWDDVKNLVPASNLSNLDKQNIFEAVYNELPEGAEILLPKSGPENYATRGTIAGLLRLSRDPRFRPGSPGTVLYQGKNGLILTYQGTSFIKEPLNKYNRKPIYVSTSPWEAPDLVEYSDYVKMRGEKLKKIAPDKILDYVPDPNNPLDLFMIQEEGFHPMYKMTPGTNLKALLNENIRRLKAIYKENFTDAHVLQMKLKGSAPYYLGYFDDSGTSGLHNVKRNLNMIELNPYSKLHTDMMHEGIMHGTDTFLTDYTASLYLNFIDKIMNSPEILYKNGVPHYKWLGINTRPVPEGTDIWYEGRSTFGELRKAMYDNIAKNKSTKVTEDTFESLRPEFEHQVDNMSLEEASKSLKRTNPYGDVYGSVGPKVNPNFLSEFKGLLKYAPISIPFIFPTDKKKKGGKVFKDLKPSIVKDVKGNSWFEFAIPKNILLMELQYKDGGIL